MDSWTPLSPIRVYRAGLRIYKVRCSWVVGFVLIQIIFIFLKYLIRITWWGEWKELGWERGLHNSFLHLFSPMPPTSRHVSFFPLKMYLFLFHVFKRFACMYLSVPCARGAHRARRGYYIPWNRSRNTCELWVLETEPRSVGRAATSPHLHTRF